MSRASPRVACRLGEASGDQAVFFRDRVVIGSSFGLAIILI